jgi:hypothetical protein
VQDFSCKRGLSLGSSWTGLVTCVVYCLFAKIEDFRFSYHKKKGRKGGREGGKKKRKKKEIAAVPWSSRETDSRTPFIPPHRHQSLRMPKSLI